MHKVIGGIRPLAPGYAKVLIAPQPGEGIDWAKTSLKTPHGTVRVEWRLDGGALEVEATVPEGVEADIELSGGERRSVGGGIHSFAGDYDVLVR
jgi:alpha-L-rhamnosidase